VLGQVRENGAAFCATRQGRNVHATKSRKSVDMEGWLTVALLSQARTWAHIRMLSALGYAEMRGSPAFIPNPQDAEGFPYLDRGSDHAVH